MALGVSVRRKCGSGGVTHSGPIRARINNPGNIHDIQDELFGQNFNARCEFFDDFIGPALNTFNWTIKDVSSGGTPTAAYVANIANGEFAATHDNTSEAQVIGLFTNDQLFVESSREFFFQTRVKISGAATNTRFVFGLASAYNGTFDSVTKNAWFRVEGNDLSLYAEADDDTTNTDDQDTGIDLVADTYVTLTIDGSRLDAIRYLVDSLEVKTINAAAMTGTLQPFLMNQKASGTTTGSFTVDFVRLGWNRV